ncbi:uncharacterized protein [Petaurus breviceps papuanus]|uniref:uncharacterized protein n=1 Tax=Petaurus breviceps papuanus TaxID=3040969 RepID=UPI0036DDCB6D
MQVFVQQLAPHPPCRSKEPVCLFGRAAFLRRHSFRFRAWDWPRRLLGVVVLRRPRSVWRDPLGHVVSRNQYFFARGRGWEVSYSWGWGFLPEGGDRTGVCWGRSQDRSSLTEAETLATGLRTRLVLVSSSPCHFLKKRNSRLRYKTKDWALKKEEYENEIERLSSEISNYLNVTNFWYQDTELLNDEHNNIPREQANNVSTQTEGALGPIKRNVTTQTGEDDTRHTSEEHLSQDEYEQ